MAAIISLALAASLRSTPTLGVAEGRCRPDEAGPAILVDVIGLKDRRGRLKLEVYPSNDEDFLADDNILVGAGKTFRRVEQPVPARGPVTMCVRIPHAGAYSLSLLHDRDGNRKFSFLEDGVGFSNNPKLGHSKPSAQATKLVAGSGVTSISIVMNYRRGLLSFGPIGERR
ncbi:MAG: hypothetical protein JWN69_154 [Alphaproteobacteria bacterium]|nr:hypothetical protein [Alphaproteobacteria bacterium]